MARRRKPDVDFIPDHRDLSETVYSQLVYLDGVEIGFVDKYEAEEIETSLYGTRTIYRWKWEPMSEDYFQSEALQEPDSGGFYREFTNVRDLEKAAKLQGYNWYTLPQIRKALRELLQKTPEDEREAGIEEAIEWAAAREQSARRREQIERENETEQEREVRLYKEKRDAKRAERLAAFEAEERVSVQKGKP